MAVFNHHWNAPFQTSSNDCFYRSFTINLNAKKMLGKVDDIVPYPTEKKQFRISSSSIRNYKTNAQIDTLTGVQTIMIKEKDLFFPKDIHSWRGTVKWNHGRMKNCVEIKNRRESVTEEHEHLRGVGEIHVYFRSRNPPKIPSKKYIEGKESFNIALPEVSFFPPKWTKQRKKLN